MTPASEEPGPGGVSVLLADAHVVVVDKPSGTPSVPARTPADPPCVAALLREEYGVLEAVHRLDRDTSGVLVLARTAAARSSLGVAFQNRGVCKRYEALVSGSPSTSAGEIHLPLAADPLRPPRHRVDPINGRIAITRWRLVCGGEHPAGRRSLLALEPLTGRSHQLRVHLAWLGLPIVGDMLYGPAMPGSASVRLALHARWLRFPHPEDGRPVEVASAHELEAIGEMRTHAARDEWMPPHADGRGPSSAMGGA